MPDEIIVLLTKQSEDLGQIKAHLETLVGNGQPGLIKEMRDDINSLKDSRSHMRGYLAGLGGAFAVAEFIYHYVMHKMGVR